MIERRTRIGSVGVFVGCLGAAVLTPSSAHAYANAHAVSMPMVDWAEYPASATTFSVNHWVSGKIEGTSRAVCRTSSGKVSFAQPRVENGKAVTTCLNETHTVLKASPNYKWSSVPGGGAPANSVPVKGATGEYIGAVCLGAVGSSEFPGFMPKGDTKCHVRFMGAVAGVNALKVLTFSTPITEGNAWLNIGASWTMPLYAETVAGTKYLCEASSDGKMWLGHVVPRNGTGPSYSCRVLKLAGNQVSVADVEAAVVFSNKSPSTRGGLKWLSRSSSSDVPGAGGYEANPGAVTCRGSGLIGVLDLTKKCRISPTASLSSYEVLVVTP